MHLIDRDKLLDDLINKVPKTAEITEATLPVLICEQPVIKAIPITREQVKKMRGEWKHRFTTEDSVFCTSCKTTFRAYYDEYNFCPYCGAPMTYEAVDILWKRLEVMQGDSSQD